jgi:integrase/recombinase XerC/integrase/recombinase XerD
MKLQTYQLHSPAVTVTGLHIPDVTKGGIVAAFIASLDVKANSRDLYQRTLKQYIQWVDARGYLLSEITREHILEYKEELLASGKSSLTVASYLTSLKAFYIWAEAIKAYPNVAKGVKLPKRKQQFRKQPLQPSQVEELLGYYNGTKRDFAIVNLLLRTGLRTVEVTRADVGDIVFKGGQRVLLVHGKGRDEKDNFVILTAKTYGPIADYLATRPTNKEGEPLFLSTSNNNTGGRLTTRTISGMAKDGLRAIGLGDKAYTAHSLRHTGATNILRATGDLEKTRLFCRHANPATTLIYTQTLEEERRLNNSGEAILDTLF